MPYDAFISHSSAAKLTAYAICNELESNGIRCWILPRDLTGGAGWDQSISRAIQSCRVVIVVQTGTTNRSERVEKQIELALAKGAVVIPFRTNPSPASSESEEPTDSLHWLDAVTPEISERIKNLYEQVRGIVYKNRSTGLDTANSRGGKNATGPKNEQVPVLLDEGRSTAASGDLELEQLEVETPPERGPLVARRSVFPDEFRKDELVSKKRNNISNLLKLRAIALILLPFAIILGVGFWSIQPPRGKLPSALISGAVTNSPNPPQPVASATPLPESGVALNASAATSDGALRPSPTLIIVRREEIGASDPGWGPTDANWAHPDNQIRLTPLMGNGAILVNTVHQFKDADVSAEVAMSKGEDTDQLGGLIFWAKDYNDCYALVVSADGKFAIGRKLFGRWINPTAKTGSTAVKTGIGQVNRLRVQTQGNVFTASINDIKVATLTGEPPKGTWFIGVYGESAELSENAWDFTKLRVAVTPEASH
jgi:hypothetical protein